MCREDGGDIYPSFFGQGQGNASQPLMEVSNDGSFLLMCYVLDLGQKRARGFARISNLAQEPCHQVTKHHRLICLVIPRRTRNRRGIPEVCFPLVQKSITRSRVNEQYPRRPLDKPSPVYQVDTPCLHVGNCLRQLGVRWG